MNFAILDSVSDVKCKRVLCCDGGCVQHGLVLCLQYERPCTLLIGDGVGKHDRQPNAS